MVSPLVRCFSAPATLNRAVPVATPSDTLSGAHSEPIASTRQLCANSAASEIFAASLPRPIKTGRQAPRKAIGLATKRLFRALASSWEAVTSESAHVSTSNSPRSDLTQSPMGDFSPYGTWGDHFMSDDPRSERTDRAGKSNETLELPIPPYFGG